MLRVKRTRERERREKRTWGADEWGWRERPVSGWCLTALRTRQRDAADLKAQAWWNSRFEVHSVVEQGHTKLFKVHTVDRRLMLFCHIEKNKARQTDKVRPIQIEMSADNAPQPENKEVEYQPILVSIYIYAAVSQVFTFTQNDCACKFSLPFKCHF